jgi:hypothetical protein
VLVSMRTHGGEEVEKEEARERTMRSPEFGPEVYEYEEELSVLPPWMTSVGGEGRYAAAWPHLTRDQLVLHTILVTHLGTMVYAWTPPRKAMVVKTRYPTRSSADRRTEDVVPPIMFHSAGLFTPIPPIPIRRSIPDAITG